MNEIEYRGQRIRIQGDDITVNGISFPTVLEAKSYIDEEEEG